MKIENKLKFKSCEICGITSDKKKVTYSTEAEMLLCSKHKNQFNRYKKFFDSSQISIDDLNEISIDKEDESIAYIHLYDKYGIEQCVTKIDSFNIDKCKNIRWRLSKKKNKLYVIGGSSKNQKYIARHTLDYNGNKVVDHIDGDSLNNCVNNLRIISVKDNITNTSPRINSKTHIRGVSFNQAHNTYSVDFYFKKNRLYFKQFEKIEEAVYIRYLCELEFYKEFRYFSNDELIMHHIDKLSKNNREELDMYFKQKIYESSGVLHVNKNNI